MRTVLILMLVGFCLFCGWLVADRGLFQIHSNARQPLILLQQTTDAAKSKKANPPPKESLQLKADFVRLHADNAPEKTVTIGSIDPRSGFKFQLELSSKGAAVSTATFSEFDDRHYKDPQPLQILSPVDSVLSMANRGLVLFLDGQEYKPLPLDKLHWQTFYVQYEPDGSQTVRFEALIKIKDTSEPVIKLSKTYKVVLGSYLLECALTVENLMASELKSRLNLAGPLGIGREAVRADMRKVVAGFKDSQGKITSARLEAKKLRKAKTLDERRLTEPGTNFLWVAAINKYFAAILVPVPESGKQFCDWVTDKTGWFYNPDGDERADSGDETVGVKLAIAPTTLAPTDHPNSKRIYKFQLYLGPKDKSLFDKNQLYRDLGFVQTIDFMACCCPASIINPLAFGILAAMRWMYGFIGNYGVVIIILVFLVRIAMHPITKKSQVSMSKFGKLAPKVEEIKKKYANNKAEMNKQIMALYKEQGASPIMGFLPMMFQMPIWIALWSAIYTSIELRGAAFLPFWITDLSVPDALFRFPAVTLPLFGKLDSFNLLPLLMGVAFYLQQKLMPSQPATNPQAEQQQKMMKVIFPLLFPLMLYKGPSGVNLYIMASTFAGVIEQHVIRKHIREKEQAGSQGLVAATSKTGGKVKKKKPKPFYRNM